jgi:hypothetical protein
MDIASPYVHHRRRQPRGTRVVTYTHWLVRTYTYTPIHTHTHTLKFPAKPIHKRTHKPCSYFYTRSFLRALNKVTTHSQLHHRAQKKHWEIQSITFLFNKCTTPSIKRVANLATIRRLVITTHPPSTHTCIRTHNPPHTTTQLLLFGINCTHTCTVPVRSYILHTCTSS